MPNGIMSNGVDPYKTMCFVTCTFFLLENSLILLDQILSGAEVGGIEGKRMRVLITS